MSEKKMPPLYGGDIMQRVMDRIDETRLNQQRLGHGGRNKKYTVYKLCQAIGTSKSTFDGWFKSRKVKPPVVRLDQLMAHMEFDLLDLLKPEEIAEAYCRMDRWKKDRTRKHFKAKSAKIAIAMKELAGNSNNLLDIEGKPLQTL